jgi:hypothetical protein
MDRQDRGVPLSRLPSASRLPRRSESERTAPPRGAMILVVQSRSLSRMAMGMQRPPLRSTACRKATLVFPAMSMRPPSSESTWAS